MLFDIGIMLLGIAAVIFFAVFTEAFAFGFWITLLAYRDAWARLYVIHGMNPTAWFKQLLVFTLTVFHQMWMRIVDPVYQTLPYRSWRRDRDEE